MNLSIVTKEMFGQNEMNIYQNEQNEIFMTREQVGIALGYNNPVIAVGKIHGRHKERLDELSVLTRLVSTDGKAYNMTIYNEKGIYEIIRRSAQPKADEFYDWVYDLLSELRRGDLQVNDTSNTKLLLKAALEHEEKIETIESDVNYLKGNMRIDSLQQQDLQQTAKKAVVRALGGKGSNAYQEMSGKTFPAFWKEFKQHFKVPRYPDLPKVKYDEAIEFIELWSPSTSLRMDIDACNNQMKASI